MKKTLAALVFGGLVFNSAFGAVHSVENIPQKGEGDFLLASEINSILKTISGIFFDDSNGNVGIGTTDPESYRLKVHRGGSTSWVSRFSNDAGWIDVGPANTEWAHIYTDRPRFIFNKPVYSVDDTFSSYDNDLQLQTAGTTRVFVEKDNGNVGIGTTNPGAKLEVVGDIKTSGANRRISDENGDWSVGGTGENLEFREPEQENKVWGYFQDDWGLHLTGAPNLATSGHVRIRNTSPTLYLTDSNNRSGMIHMNSNLMYFLRGCGTGSESWCSTGGRWPLYLNMENNNAHFGNEVHATKFVGDGSRLTGISTGSSKWSGSGNIYYSGGNVGIGTKSPSEKLEVGGSVKISEDLKMINADQEIRLKTGRIISQSVPNRLTFESFASGQPLFLRGPGGIQFYSRGERMRILSNGNIGIGTTSPSEKLHVSGKVKATSFINSSDRTKKQNIKSLENAIEIVQNLRGVEFEWKENGQKSIGFIAQEVEEILPEIVHGEEGEKSVEYGNLTAILVEAVKAQQAQIEDLKKEVASLKK